MSEDPSEYLASFEAFIIDKKISRRIVYKKSDIKYHVVSAMMAIQNDGKHHFEVSLNEIKERRLNEHSQWIYDDIFLFVMTAGILKFDIDRSWINELCVKRINNQSGEKKHYTETFHYLLNDSKAGLSFINVVCFSIINFEYQLSDSEVIDGYQQAKQVLKISNDKLYKTISQATVEHVIKLKGLDNLELRARQLRFINNFQNRSKIISNIIFWFLFIAFVPVVVYLFYFLLKINQNMPDGSLKVLVSNLLASVVSLSTFSFAFWKRQNIIDWLNRKLHKFWGNLSPSKLED